MNTAVAMTQEEYEHHLKMDISEFYLDPVAFVRYTFPWGQKGTDLADFDGPDKWQEDLLQDIAASIITPDAPRRFAVASGHGIGKGAVTAWIILWFMSTRANGRGVVTANTFNQLNGKTWAELSLWHKRSINRAWFTWTATRFFEKENPETWFVDAIANNPRNSEAFAGLHARDVLVIFDESSGIEKSIYEVTEGAMTTEGALWITLGNPTRNSGPFRESFGRFKHRWNTRHIDSRSAKMTDKKLIKEWEDDHGATSDFFKVRVLGQFPVAGSNQLISGEAVEQGRKLELHPEEWSAMPVSIGCDVARFGSDETVIIVRQGRKMISMDTYRELDNVQVAMKCAEVYRKYHGAILLVDEVGLGSGVVDTLKSLSYPVIGVNAGRKPDDSTRFVNLRAEMWYRMKEWVEAGADITDDNELCEQLITIEYSFSAKEQVVIEKKEDMKKRGMSSPDRADALALTFAHIALPSQTISSFEAEDYT